MVELIEQQDWITQGSVLGPGCIRLPGDVFRHCWNSVLTPETRIQSFCLDYSIGISQKLLKDSTPASGLRTSPDVHLSTLSRELRSSRLRDLYLVTQLACRGRAGLQVLEYCYSLYLKF